MSLLGLLGTAAGAFFGGPVGASIGGAIGGSLDQSNAASSAAKATGAATDQSIALQRQIYEQNRADQTPFREAGVNALGKLQGMADYQKFGINQFTQDPGYAFRLQQGQKALDASAAARGGLISGNALRAAQGYGQEMGSQEYQNAFNRYETERQATLSPYMTLAGFGTGANTANAQSGQNYATGVGNALINQGANVGNAGMIGSNAMTSGLTGALTAYGRSPVSFNSLYGNSNPYQTNPYVNNPTAQGIDQSGMY
jgi:hypothetical protein